MRSDPPETAEAKGFADHGVVVNKLKQAVCGARWVVRFLNDNKCDSRKFATVDERFVKSRILKRMHGYENFGAGLLGGLGHDAGVLRNPLEPEESLLVNTDRSL